MAETLDMCLWKAAASACGDEPEVGVGLRASSQEEEAGTETRMSTCWKLGQEAESICLCHL